MTADELVVRAKNQLEGKQPEFPCIETCHAILELGRIRSCAEKECANLRNGIEYAKHDKEKLEEKIKALEAEVAAEKERSSSYKFLNAIAYTFIRETAEDVNPNPRVAASRLFDLHKDNLDIRLLRCHCVRDYDDARRKFDEWCNKMGEDFSERRFLDWLLSERVFRS